MQGSKPFQITGSLWVVKSKYKQIGNAVPVNLAKYIVINY